QPDGERVPGDGGEHGECGPGDRRVQCTGDRGTGGDALGDGHDEEPGGGRRDGDDGDAVLPVGDVVLDVGVGVPGDAQRGAVGGGNMEHGDDGGDDSGGAGGGKLLPDRLHGRVGASDRERQLQQPD